MQFTKKNMASSQTWCETKTGIYFVDMVCPEFFFGFVIIIISDVSWLLGLSSPCSVLSSRDSRPIKGGVRLYSVE